MTLNAKNSNLSPFHAMFQRHFFHNQCAVVRLNTKVIITSSTTAHTHTVVSISAVWSFSTSFILFIFRVTLLFRLCAFRHCDFSLYIWHPKFDFFYIFLDIARRLCMHVCAFVCVFVCVFVCLNSAKKLIFQLIATFVFLCITSGNECSSKRPLTVDKCHFF